MSIEQQYYEWHDGPTHKPVHWGVFILVSVVVTFFLIGQIHKTYLVDFSLQKSEAATITPENLITESDLDLTGLDYYIVANPFTQGLALRDVGGDKRFYTLEQRPDGTRPALTEFSISGKSVGDTVATIRSWSNIYAGSADETDTNFNGTYHRIYWDPATSKLCTSWAVEYSGTFPTELACRTLNDNGTISNFKEISLEGRPAKSAYGGFAPVPPAFQSTYGVGPLVTGFGGITSLMSWGARLGPHLLFFPDMAGLSNHYEVPASSIKVGADVFCGTVGFGDWYTTGRRQCPERGRRLTQPNNYADYASNNQPLTLSGTVNTSGTTVTLVNESLGRDFTTAINVSWPTYGTCWWPGNHFVINNVSYVVASCTDATHIVLTTSAGTQTGVSFTSPDPFEPLGDQRNVLHPSDLPGHYFTSPAPDGYGRFTTTDGYGGACWFSKGPKTGLVMLALLGDGDITYSNAGIYTSRAAWELHVFSQAAIGSVINGTTPQEQLDWTNAINLTSRIPLGIHGQLRPTGYGVSGSITCDYGTGDIWLLVNYGESYTYPAASRLVKIPCPACADPSYTPSPSPAPVTPSPVTPTPVTPPPPPPATPPTPLPSPTPAPITTSANNTRVPPASAIRDNTGNIWTLEGVTIKRNNVGTTFGSTILWCGAQIYAQSGAWYLWNGSGFTLYGADPCANVSAPNLAGDLNSDGIVNSLDWSIMSSVWFTSNAAADLNHDGIVNSIDFSILNRNWFRSS